MNRRPTKQLMKLLERLTQHWLDPISHGEYYVHTHLPRLINELDYGTSEEQDTILQVRLASTREEWENLGKIVSTLDRFVEKPETVLEKMFQMDRFVEAKERFSKGHPQVYQQARSRRVMKFDRLFGYYRKQGRVFQLVDEIRRVGNLLTDDEMQHYQGLLDSKVCEMIDKALGRKAYDAAERLYPLVKHMLPKDQFNAMVDSAKKEDV